MMKFRFVPFTRLSFVAASLAGLLLGLSAPASFHPGAYVTAARADEQASEEKMGRAAAAQVEKQAKLVKDPAIVARVQTIGAKIAAVADTTRVHAGFGNDTVYNFKYEYKVIDSPEVNAFSLPGGHIYIYKGMLNLLRTDDELAGVLGHETAHAAHHHVVALERQANKFTSETLLGVLVAIVAHVPPDQIGDLATGVQYAQQAVLNNHFSEAAEQDADHTGMIFMQKAGYNPVGMLTMLERLQDQEEMSPEIDLGFLQDHPLTPERVSAAKAELASLGVQLTPELEAMAAGEIRARVVDASDTLVPAVKITLGNEVIALLAPEHHQEANAAAAELNKLLDNHLRNDQVRASENEVLAGPTVLIAFTPEDTRVQSLQIMPNALASNMVRAIQRKVFEIDVMGISAK